MPGQVIFKIKTIRIFFTALFISTTGLVHAQTYTPAPTPAKPITIVLDAGHGGKDGSTRGVYSKEKDVALSVALALGENIQKEIPNAKVIFTRTEDVFIPLYERIDIANRAHADLFISIHCNSMPSNMRGRTLTNGVETFVSGSGRMGEQDVAIRENASILLEKDYKQNYEGYNPNDPESFIILSLMKNGFRRQSIKLATLIQSQYVSAGRVNRGVKEQSLAVLARAGMPAVLTEIGFISNPDEEDYMNSPEGRREIVQNITTAITEYKNQMLINPAPNP
ncbi:N-acetylmuramoyl-L-alanine amidase [Pedobacter antarcticus 4BY]|uniref:N-acetylmuramoyl-L-alanine amidase n=2 Tax=Pedobacter antarcticus TaxID=34086 RepID=A0A081PL24_9SPHI|nr:N-acetylmuramoyl-L-alanine amidase [Pedobacter antarcticus]KEQ31397.1 N-acetylmuramoyl-L-alanine amidase [Pedobacter antarcticus 4BY]SFE39256.1 N-acetylmuramoyl-L-alanine amidase [Pedobacter antarcticus]